MCHYGIKNDSFAGGSAVMARRMTARQKQCQKISKQKAKQKKLRATWRRCAIAGGAALALALAAGSWWLARMDGAHAIKEYARNHYYRTTAALGFTVQNIYLDGRQRTPMNKVTAAINISLGDPIFALPAEELKQRLEAINQIARADVERVLPGTIHIHIREREPAAIWQHRGAMRLVDGEGVIIDDVEVAAYSQLPIIVGGEDAPLHTPQLLKVLASQGQLFPQVASAIRVGERRWNVRLKNGIEIKLPEKNMHKAWDALARMQQEQKLIDRGISAVDLRLSDRVFIKLAPAVLKPESEQARDT